MDACGDGSIGRDRKAAGTAVACEAGRPRRCRRTRVAVAALLLTLAAGQTGGADDAVPHGSSSHFGPDSARTRSSAPLLGRAARDIAPLPRVAAGGLGLAVTGLLAPGGIERPQWRSFDAVGPAMSRRPPEDDAERFVVVLDPGHGGSDPGAAAPNGLLEKHLTLDIARRARVFLSELDDVEVVLTRENDRGLSRRSRVARVQAANADLFVSLHLNHLPQDHLTLVETYYAGPENIAESRALRAVGARPRSRTAKRSLAFTEGSQRLAIFLQRRVLHEIRHENPEVIDAGIKRDTLFVLTRSFTPGALVELTALSKPEEAERLTDAGYRDRLAAALADAIRDYRASLELAPVDHAPASAAPIAPAPAQPRPWLDVAAPGSAAERIDDGVDAALDDALRDPVIGAAARASGT